ncbi:S4 domain-containing protein YaaA [Sporolactobacillus sp. THM7-4]|nr:S4 domain-containing protein YaaA [Sporolactobacillus sp. THM7-4]
MNHVKLNQGEEYMTLGQFLKLTGTIHTGGEAKVFLMNTEVYVNGERDIRRGKKLRPGDHIKIGEKEEYVISQS